MRGHVRKGHGLKGLHILKGFNAFNALNGSNGLSVFERALNQIS